MGLYYGFDWRARQLNIHADTDRVISEYAQDGIAELEQMLATETLVGASA